MLSNRQIDAFFICNQRNTTNSEFWLPTEIKSMIAFSQKPANAAAGLLHHVAYGELTAAEEMIKADPTLLLQASDVVTRSGLLVKRVTPYECALGAGDPEMAAMMTPYFLLLSNGKQEMVAQYMQYKPAIDAMTQTLEKQEKNQLDTLFNIIKNSSDDDITAALTKNIHYVSLLGNALRHFRDTVAPRVLTQPSMHYNYERLRYAFNLLIKEWRILNKDQTDYRKSDLVWQQIIGYLQRGLPAVDRFAFINGLQNQTSFNILKRSIKSPMYRSFMFIDTIPEDANLSQLGFDYGIPPSGIINDQMLPPSAMILTFETYLMKKNLYYGMIKELCSDAKQQEQTGIKRSRAQ